MSESIDSLLTHATRARVEQRYGEAKRNLQQAIEMGSRAKDQPRLARALAALGQIERDLHNEDDALRLYEEAVEIYRQLNSPLKLAHAMRHIADILREIGRWAASETSYHEALGIYRGRPETAALELANALRGYALLKEAVGEHTEARAMWEEAGGLYAAANVQSGVLESARRVARLTRRTSA